ncbi:unnamed protein product [Symbiodinium microadriaticum]|nr:unnamed protein product [Symbiodinium microadriaticum]
MIISYQPLISYKGPDYTNLSGHSFTSRLLYTVVPSELYASNTIDKLHEALVRDMQTLYNDGIQVACLHFIIARIRVYTCVGW